MAHRNASTALALAMIVLALASAVKATDYNDEVMHAIAHASTIHTHVTHTQDANTRTRMHTHATAMQ